MSGSSRSLIRALDTLFSNWSDEENNKTNLTEVDLVIANYIEKHNNLATIQQSTSINDELYKVYDKYVKPSKDISRECAFLDVLKQVLCVFNSKELNLWLQTYLKPALDSAGYYSEFVEKARQFIKRVSTDPLSTDDEKLEEERETIGRAVINQIMEIYLTEEARFDHFNIEVSDSQAYYERLRFIKFNCLNLLQEYGLKHISSYCMLLGEHFRALKTRHDALILFLTLVATQNSQVAHVIDSELFVDLLKCILYDFNDALVFSAYTVLVMLIPQVSNKLAKFLPDLLAIYMRLVQWYDLDKYIPQRHEIFNDFIDKDLLEWEVDYREKYPLATHVVFDWQYLGTLLYGLFVFNFIEFTAGPLNYLKRNKPRLISVILLQGLEERAGGAINLENIIVERSQEFLKTLLLHPKMIKPDKSIDRELENPIEWILEQSNDSISPEDVAIACLSLNTQILISDAFKKQLSDDLLSKYEYTSQNESQNKLSRNSSLAGPMYFSTKDGPMSKMLQQTLQNRKMSIIPTNLVIDGHENGHTNNDSQNGHAGTGNGNNSLEHEIKFKEVKFSDDNYSDADISRNGGLYDNFMSNVPSSLALHHEPHRQIDPIPELLSTHEKLYLREGSIGGHDSSDNDDKKSVNNVFNEKGKYELRLSRPMSSPTTIVETSSVFKSPAGTNGTSGEDIVTTNPIQMSRNSINATAIDFYQRELLLYKNELEFSSYMKHLNKFHYLKLRQNDVTGNKAGEVSGPEEFRGLLEQTKNQLVNLSDEYNRERETLVSRLQEISAERDELLRKLDDESARISSEAEKYVQLTTEIVPAKDYEIETLKLKLVALEKELKGLQMSSKEADHNGHTAEADGVDPDSSAVYELRTKLQSANERYYQTTQELRSSHEAYEKMVKKYEDKLATSKLSLHDNLNAFTREHEKKIQELSTTLLKYENLLEERNAKILQLSSSKPISIPLPTRGSTGGSSSNKLGRNDSYDRISNASSSPPGAQHMPPQLPHHHTNPIFPPAPSAAAPIHHQHNSQFLSNPAAHYAPHVARHNTAPIVNTSQQQAQAVPIIRGRGGYQKRSKKLM
ncbi:Tuberous sclerosis 1 [Candida viswanathii]|uniref:Tuberous sclerosis 1 n=1 Tax=Candida viswanathii TaxID=5486 RepID=A0A367YNT5_9ASCO|nr:Tuberous sclerosis 1 [Candida viswanathii]